MAASLHITNLSVALTSQDRSFRLEVESLSLQGGETIGLTGPSGTGKTLFLEVLGLLRAPDPGSTYQVRSKADVEDITPLWQTTKGRRRCRDLRGSLFGFVPQSGGLLPFLSVRENIALSQKVSGRIDAAWHSDLIERLGLVGLEALYPSALSIGQRQRVAIARALAHRPPFLIADEPTAALDPTTAEEAMALLVQAAAHQKSALVISSHDLDLLDRIPMQRMRLATHKSDRGQSVVSWLSILKEQAA